MTRLLRWLVVLVTSSAALSIGGGAAVAQTTSTTTGANSCYSSLDNTTYDTDLTVDGSSTPDVLAAGESTTLAASLSGTLPDWLPAYGYSQGLLTVGDNQIPTRTWVALEGVGSVEQVQIVEADVDVVATVQDPDGVPGSGDEGGVPPSLEVELPPTTWTSTGGSIELRQASGSPLTSLPGMGSEGASVTPQGSMFISATLSEDQRINLDCQPGTAAESTVDPMDTAPPITIAPAFQLPEDVNSTDYSGIVALAAVVFVAIGIGILVWYANRARNAAVARQAERESIETDEPDDTSS